MPGPVVSPSEPIASHPGPAILAAALGCLVLAGCASQSRAPPAPPLSPAVTPTTSATYSAELCSAAAEYQTAANAIVTLDASQVGTDGVKKALQDLETAANNLELPPRSSSDPRSAELEGRRVTEGHHRGAQLIKTAYRPTLVRSPPRSAWSSRQPSRSWTAFERVALRCLRSKHHPHPERNYPQPL